MSEASKSEPSGWKEWLFAVATGIACTVVPGLYFHFLPVPDSESVLHGTLILSSGNGTITLVPVGGDPPSVEVTLPARPRTSQAISEFDSDVLLVTQQDPWWDAATNSFWATSSMGDDRQDDAAISSFNGDGSPQSIRFVTSTQSLAWATSYAGSEVAYEANSPKGFDHVSIVDVRTAAAHRIASWASGPISRDDGGDAVAFPCSATVGQSPTACVYDLADRQLSTPTIPGLTSVQDAALSPSGNTLAVIGLGGPQVSPVLALTDAQGQEVRILIRDGRSLTSVAWSPDGRDLAYVSASGLYVRDVATGHEDKLLAGSYETVQWTPTPITDFGVS